MCISLEATAIVRMSRAEVLVPDEVATAHLFSRTVRRCFRVGEARLAGKNFDHRMVWVLDHPLRSFSVSFRIDLLAFACLAVGQAFFTVAGCVAEESENPELVSEKTPSLESLLREFRDYSGAELVFHRDDLPEGRYHDVLKPLPDSRKSTAAAICLEEAKMYPPRFFHEVGLKAVGVFAACASKTTSDRSRPFDKQLGGYRYFGVYNGNDAVAAAFYSDGQLALTFHHEFFHHVDSTVGGITDPWQLSSDDAFYQAAISGRKPHAAPPIAGEDLISLRDRCIGFTLRDAVSEYASKNSREDQAETARHLMSMLPNSLVQTIDQPELAGSQRILHVLLEIENSVPDGPGFGWFVDVALQRSDRDAKSETVDQLLSRLRAYANGGRSGYAGVSKDPAGARAALKAVVRVNPETVDPQQAVEFVQHSTHITSSLLRQRIRPDSTQSRFDVWGSEDSNGVNHTLRRDVSRFGSDARRLKLIWSIHLQQDSPSTDREKDPLGRVLLNNLRLIARYFDFIQSNWSMTPGTRQVFESTQRMILDSLPDGNSDLLELAK